MANQEPRPSEDTREARRHVQEAEDNRNALAEQARRVDATTPSPVERPGPAGEG